MQSRRDCLFWKIEKYGMEPSYLYGSMHTGNSISEDVYQSVSHNDFTQIWMESIPDVDSHTDEANLARTIHQIKPTNSTVRGLDEFSSSETKKLFRMIAKLNSSGLLPGLKNITTEEKTDLKSIFAIIDKGLTTEEYKLTEEDINKFLGILSKLSLSGLLDAMNRELTSEEKAAQKDIKSMYNLYKRTLSSAEFEFIINERNARWLKKAFQKGNELIVVGAVHLFGKKGLLNSLLCQGYYITPLEPNTSHDILFDGRIVFKTPAEIEKAQAAIASDSLMNAVLSGKKPAKNLSFDELKDFISNILTQAEKILVENPIENKIKQYAGMYAALFNMSTLTRELNKNTGRLKLIASSKDLIAKTQNPEELKSVMEAFGAKYYNIDTGKISENETTVREFLIQQLNKTYVSNSSENNFIRLIFDAYSTFTAANSVTKTPQNKPK